MAMIVENITSAVIALLINNTGQEIVILIHEFVGPGIYQLMQENESKE